MTILDIWLDIVGRQVFDNQIGSTIPQKFTTSLVTAQVPGSPIKFQPIKPRKFIASTEDVSRARIESTPREQDQGWRARKLEAGRA